MIEQGEVFETLDYLKDQGKIRFYGVSAEMISDALLCLKHTNISSLQVVLNLLDQRAVKELLPLAQQKKIGIIARVPLASGLLTKQMTVQTGQTVGRIQMRTARANVEKFSFLVNEGARTISQAAIQFVLHQPQVSVVIPGTKKSKELEDNIGAIEAPSLTIEELQQIALLSQLDKVPKG